MQTPTVQFFGGQKFTSGRTVRWTEFAKCFACEEKFVGRGRTANAAHADAEHWAALHAEQCTGEEF